MCTKYDAMTFFGTDKVIKRFQLQGDLIDQKGNTFGKIEIQLETGCIVLE